MPEMNFIDTVKIGEKLMAVTKEKGTDEIYCRSCGETIKEKAEICPHCGVRNEKAGSTSNKSTTSPPSTTHDPTQFTTTVSGDWYYAIGGSVGLWIVALMFSSASSILGSIAGFSMLIAWAVMPVGMYFDKQYLRANSEWNPNALLWILAAIIPFISIIAGAVYLYRRHEVIGTP